MGKLKDNLIRHQEQIDNPTLNPSANWQTQYRGSNDAEYQIYKTAAEDLGWQVKTYDEWLNS